MALTLYYHPLSSYCHKVLVALDELALPFERHLVDLGDPQARAAFLRLWPTGKMPLLLDAGVPVPETSIIIEHLQQRHAGAHTLLPGDAEAALEVRLWDRLLDLYVMTPMQAIVADRLRPEAQRDPTGVRAALAMLESAYGWIDRRLADRTWLAGAEFSMADCAAAPALFYAVTLAPLPADRPQLAAYFERLMARPSVQRTLAQARPYFRFYPAREGIAARFLDATASEQ
jgi:glutathione S-transferase